jgi:hypothetical protein
MTVSVKVVMKEKLQLVDTILFLAVVEIITVFNITVDKFIGLY